VSLRDRGGSAKTKQEERDESGNPRIWQPESPIAEHSDYPIPGLSDSQIDRHQASFQFVFDSGSPVRCSVIWKSRKSWMAAMASAFFELITTRAPAAVCS
jgi:hypothetical protein